MRTQIINESGYEAALFGLGLSFGLTSGLTCQEFVEDTKLFARVEKVAANLAHRDGGHNKVIESMQVWMDIDAPRFWWSEADTYRSGITKNSESTMHTLSKNPPTQANFESGTPTATVALFQDMWPRYKDNIVSLKSMLPEGFLQRRIVCTNYKTLRNMILQRHDHRLPQWREFCIDLGDQLKHPKMLGKDCIILLDGL